MRHHFWFSTLTAMFMVWACSGAGAQADLIVGNLAVYPDGLKRIRGPGSDLYGGWFAQQFTTGSTPYSLDFVSTFLGDSTGSFTGVAQLRSDASDLPGAVLTNLTFPTLPDGITTVYDLIPLTPTILQPSTTYWVSFGVQSLDVNAGYDIFDTTLKELFGTGSFGPYSVSFSSGAAWYSSSFSTVNLDVYGTPVPEPPTIVLAAAGCVALLTTAARRRRLGLRRAL